MIWNIITFETPRGEKPINEFIKKQNPSARSKIIHKIRLLKRYGNQLSMPHAKTLGEGLYEIRVRGKEELRIFYCFEKQTIHLLHAFKKQTQDTPQKEINLALNRMKSLTGI